MGLFSAIGRAASSVGKKITGVADKLAPALSLVPIPGLQQAAQVYTGAANIHQAATGTGAYRGSGETSVAISPVATPVGAPGPVVYTPQNQVHNSGDVVTPVSPVVVAGGAVLGSLLLFKLLNK